MDKENKYDVLIFDCYNVFYRWLWQQDEILTKLDDKFVHIEGVVGFVKAVETYIKKFANENCKVYFLFDNAQTVWERKQKFESYKGCRKPMSDNEYKQLDLCELIVKYFRDDSFLFRVKFLEADDFVKNIIRSYVNPNDKVLMISEDLDWCRFLSENVHQYKDHCIWDIEYFTNIKGYHPTETNIMFDKTFYGDDSDNINGVLPNLPKQFFNLIIKSYDNIDNFIDDACNKKLNYLDLGWITKIHKEIENLKTNWNLVKSAEISDDELAQYKINCQFKENKLFIIYSTLNLLGKIDERIHSKKSSHSIFDMLDGEEIGRKE